MKNKKDYSELLSNAKEAGRRRDYNTAIDLLVELLSKSDEYPEALFYLGRSYHAIQHFHKAVQAIKFFLIIKPDFAPAHFFLGRSYLALELHKKAIFHLKKSLEKNTSFAPALSFLGLAYLKLRKSEIALQYFKKALEADPENTRINNGYLNALLVQAIKLFYRGALDDAFTLKKTVITITNNHWFSVVEKMIYWQQDFNDYINVLTRSDNALADGVISDMNVRVFIIIEVYP